MATTINADTTNGLVLTPDTSGDINLQSAGVTKASITSAGLTVGGSNISPQPTFRNLIINGDMRIDQRNAGASVTLATATYTLDRFVAIYTLASKFSIQQNAASVTPPVGFTNYLGVTSLSAYSVLSGELFDIRQRIEGYNIADLNWGTANAKTVTISFWVRSSLTGTFGGAIKNSANNRSYPFNYTISVANTWEQKTITVAGDTTGTWLTTTGIGMQLIFGLGTGATYSGTAGAWAAANYTSATGAVSVVGTSGATWYVTGLQLEVGTTATDFENLQYGQQLSLCQRYYWQRNGDSTYAGIGAGTMNGPTTARIFFNYPVPMRTTPTISVTNIGNTIVAQGGDLTPSTITPYANSTGAMADIETGAGTAGRGAVWIFNATVSASVQATSEL